MTASSNVFCEKASIFTSVSITLIGLGLSMTAIFLPSWQVVNLREYNSIHEHGLWRDCTRHSRDGNSNVLLRRYMTNTEPLNCVYKFDYDKYLGTFDLEDDNSPIGEVNRHKFYGWHIATLILLGLALLTSFLSICLGFCACRYGSLALIFTVVNLLTTFLSVVAEGLFFLYSHHTSNRFVKGIVGTYEQRVGLAFFLQMIACACHFIAFLISLLFVFVTLTGKSDASERYSFNQNSKLNPASIGRSLEFEPQMIFQQSVVPNGGIRPPHYTKHQEQYEKKTMAESMPELGGARNLSSPQFPGQRVRRKSETCV